MLLRPFFWYYGGKWKIAPRYPTPGHDTIVEPFAGAAGYSTRYHDRKVILFDKSPYVVGVWNFLIKSSEKCILSLPDIPPSGDLSDLVVCQEARWLIGYWTGAGDAHPRQRISSSWFRRDRRAPRGYWCDRVRQRLANQVRYIRHWAIKEASYLDAPNMNATWFIDPPYARSGKRYLFASSIDYAHLAHWSRERRGTSIVCEQVGADWLPFVPLVTTSSVANKPSAECVFVCRNKE